MPDAKDFYGLLENQFLTYADLSSVTIKDSGDPMVPLGPDFPGKVLVIDEGMKAYTGEHTFVRASLVPLLTKAQEHLREILPDCDLEVVYGYRHLDIQTAKYETRTRQVLEETPGLSGDALKEAAHRFIAVPEVAGHPTGGAVDIRILDADGTPRPMGTDIHAHELDTYVFSPFIDKTAWHNRQILRTCMIRAGFAPFDGEWWHFSYGDREWAYYYRKPHALFGQLRFTARAFHDYK